MSAWMYIALVVLGVVVIATERNYRKSHTPKPRRMCGRGATVHDSRTWMSKGARERWENAN